MIFRFYVGTKLIVLDFSSFMTIEKSELKVTVARLLQSASLSHFINPTYRRFLGRASSLRDAMRSLSQFINPIYKRFLGRASSLRDAMRSLSHFISLNCERFLGRASLSLDIQNSRYKLLGTHW